jgi:hypothetical protein
MSISAGIGLVPQAEKFGRDLSGNQYGLYTLVRERGFVYNKGNSLKFPEGCIYLLQGSGSVAAPNVFICFRLKEQFSKGFFRTVSRRTSIRHYASDNAHVIYGTAYDESLGDQLRVTVIANGLSSVARRAEQPAGSQGHGLGTPAYSYEDRNTPSVLRSPHNQAAAKVDALVNNGMDEIEIPAFLRKQAD